MFIHSSVRSVVECPDLNVLSDNAGVAWVRVKLPDVAKPILIAGLYRPPDSLPAVWDRLATSIAKALTLGNPTCVFGDFNGRHRNWDTTTNTSGSTIRRMAKDNNLAICNLP